METPDNFSLMMHSPLRAQNAGLFISRGAAMHPTRIIDTHELIFVKQGELDMWEEDKTFHLEAGQTLHLWPARQHGSVKPMPIGLKFYWIHFEIQECAKNGWNRQNHFYQIKRIPQLGCIRQPERLERLFRIFLEDQEKGVLDPHFANLLTMLMLIEVAHSTDEKTTNDNNANAIATWAHTYIRINFDRPISTHKIAAAIGYNADYLGRIYHQMYGCTLTEAIHQRRIHVACDYLLDSNMTIEQIAQKCGFGDPEYFRRVFRRYMQISPGNYRKKHSQIHINSH